MFDRLKSLAVFAKVAEVRSFSGAAKVLGITDVVSQHVSQLEKDLDVALIYRSTRTLKLTDAGEKLAISSQQMLDVAETGIDEIVEDDSKPSGKLSISTPGIADYDPFMDGLTKYIQLFPDVDLTVSFEDKIVDLIREGYDMAIRNSGAMADSTLMSRKLIDNELVLACSPDYIEKHGKVNHPSELVEAGYKWIGNPAREKTTTLRRKDNPDEIIEIPIQRSITVNSYLASYNLAMRGNGLTSISMLDHGETMQDSLLVEPLPEWEFEPMSFHAVWPANAGSKSLIRHFLNFILAEIAKGMVVPRH